MAKDYYAILKVKPTASDDEIKQAYRRLSKMYHPDVNKNYADKFIEINEAHSIIGNPDNRKKYDDELKAEKMAQHQQAQQQARPRPSGSSAGARPNFGAGFGHPKAGDVKNLHYVAGYNQAAMDYKKKYEEQLSVLTKENARLVESLKAYENSLKEYEKSFKDYSNLHSKERSGIQNTIAQYMERIRVEEQARLKAETERVKLESELRDIKKELSAVKEELELANEAIDTLIEEKGGAPKKQTVKEEDDYEEEFEEEEEDYDDETKYVDPEFWDEFDANEEKASAGDPVAQNAMGEYYLYGKGVDQDLATAVEWFLKSANNNDPNGLLNYGMCLFYGEGIAKDLNKAKEYIKKAANLGNNFAANFYELQGW